MSFSLPTMFLGLVIGVGAGAGAMLLMDGGSNPDATLSADTSLQTETPETTPKDDPQPGTLKRAEKPKTVEAPKVDVTKLPEYLAMVKERDALTESLKTAEESIAVKNGQLDEARSQGFVITEPEKPLTPEEIAQRKTRATELTAGITEALANGGSKDALLKMMNEFRDLGVVVAKEYFDMYEKFSEKGNPWFGGNPLDVTINEYGTLMPPALRDYAIANPNGDLSVSARVSATYTLAFDVATTPDKKIEPLLSVLKTSNSQYLTEAALFGLKNTGSKVAVPALSNVAISAAEDPKLRATAIRFMANNYANDADWDQLGGLANDSSPEVRNAVRYANNTRNPGATGLLVTTVTDGSQAQSAGIHEGDIVVRYNNHAITDIGSLTIAKQGLAESDSTVIEIWRDGQVVPFTVNGGQIGINGNPVTKK